MFVCLCLPFCRLFTLFISWIKINISLMGNAFYASCNCNAFFFIFFLKFLISFSSSGEQCQLIIISYVLCGYVFISSYCVFEYRRTKRRDDTMKSRQIESNRIYGGMDRCSKSVVKRKTANIIRYK